MKVEGRYVHLDRKWKPLYKMGFTKPGELEGKYHLMCLQVNINNNNHYQVPKVQQKVSNIMIVVEKGCCLIVAVAVVV